MFLQMLETPCRDCFIPTAIVWHIVISLEKKKHGELNMSYEDESHIFENELKRFTVDDNKHQ